MSVHNVIKFDRIKRKSAVEGSLEFARGNALQSTTWKQHLAECQSHGKMEDEPPVLLSSNFWFSSRHRRDAGVLEMFLGVIICSKTLKPFSISECQQLLSKEKHRGFWKLEVDGFQQYAPYL
jgi:hypothetical protein